MEAVQSKEDPMHEDPNRVFGPEDEEDEEDDSLVWVWDAQG
jgi:hypothetical protein